MGGLKLQHSVPGIPGHQQRKGLAIDPHDVPGIKSIAIWYLKGLCMDAGINDQNIGDFAIEDES